MKTNSLIIGILAIALSLASCQNKTNTTEASDTTMDMSTDTSHMAMDSIGAGSGLTAAMDKMMKDMHQMQMMGNVDHDFAMMMISHHQGAVDMAQVELESGVENNIKQMAQKITVAQKAEIADLQSFLDTHKNPAKNYDPVNTDEGFGKVLSQNMTMMMAMPKMDQTSSTDKQFVSMMIPHHESAIKMAEGFVNFGKDAKLVAMAKNMISDQNKEIQEFKKYN